MAIDKETIIYGFHVVESRIRNQPKSVKVISIDESREDERAKALIGLAGSKGIKVVRVSNKYFKELVNNKSHQGVMATVKGKVKKVNLDEITGEHYNADLLIALDGVTDPRNLGSIMRTATAFGASAIIAPKNRSVKVTDVVEKVASGAAAIMPFIQVTNLARSLRDLKDKGYWIIGADGSAEKSVQEFDLKASIVVVLGAEGKGMRRLTKETCDHLVSIPIRSSDTIDSLNVSVAAGVLLYEVSRQRGKH